MQQENRVRSEVPGRTQGHTELGVFSTPPADANTERTKTALKSNKVTNPNTGSAGEHLASSLALFKTKRGSPWSLVSSAQFENIMQDSLHGARRGSESRTKRKRPERFQQNNQLRSRSSAVTHSMEGSIHSSGRIKSLGGEKKRTQSSKRRIKSAGDDHSDGRRGVREESPPGRCASSGFRSAVPSAPSKHPSASVAQGLLRDIQGGAALFVFGERSLKHSHTLPRDYHVLQKCDKAQQLRRWPHLRSALFLFFPPNIQSLFSFRSSSV